MRSNGESAGVLFGLDFNFSTDSVFSEQSSFSSGSFPPVSGDMKLLDGTDMQFLDGTDMLLL